MCTCAIPITSAHVCWSLTNPLLHTVMSVVPTTILYMFHCCHSTAAEGIISNESGVFVGDSIE